MLQKTVSGKLTAVTQGKLNLAMLTYYLEVAVKDSWRARTSLLTTATVFAGICLLMLVLIGLKRGLVQRLHDDIMTSWSSVKVDWYATSANLSLDEEGEKSILAQLPRGSILVPEITKIVTLKTAISSVQNVTVQATVPGDPFLRFYRAEIADPRVPELVISQAIAKELRLTEASFPLSASIGMTRGDGDQAVVATLNVKICSVVGQEDTNKNAYLPRYFMEQLEDFTQGEAVIEQGWPGLPVEDSIGQQGYMAFAKQPYSPDDLNRLHMRGFKATLLSSDGSLPNSRTERRLYGLLKPHHDLHVYFVTAETQDDRREQYLNFDVTEVESITTSDDVLFYWCEPINASIDDRDHLIVGLSGSLRWLKSYLYDIQTRFTGKGMARAILPMGGDNTRSQLRLFDGQTLILECTPASQSVRELGASQLVPLADQAVNKLQTILDFKIFHKSVGKIELFEKWAISNCRARLLQVDKHYDSSRQPIAIVPAHLLAAMHRHRQGSLSYDPTHQRFQSASTPNRYFSGLFYARVLEDVPVIDEKLQQLGYSTVSTKMRVMEMQGYARTLDLLVNILQAISIALGVVTASVIFMELTRRRQTSIGIMRVMGMNSIGIFLFVFIRAILIATLGWALASLVSLIIAQALPILTNAECRLIILDYMQVLFGSVICSVLGVSFHAYMATKLDPIEAIHCGKIQ